MTRIPKALKITLFALGGLAGVLVIAGLAVLVFLDVDTYKPHVEAAASGASGMDVTVEGRLRVGFISGLRVVLEEVRIRNGEAEVASVEEVKLAIGLHSLLRRELRFDSIALNRVHIFVERGRDGRFSHETSTEVARTPQPLELPEVSFSEVDIVYADRQSGGGLELGNCNGRLTDIRHPGGAPLLSRLSLSGQFACDSVRGKEVALSELRSPMIASEGVFMFEPITMRVGGGQGSGSLRVDHSVKVPAYSLNYRLSQFRIEEFLKELPQDMSLTGPMDFSATLALRGQTPDEFLQSADGELSLSGKNLSLSGVDLDEAFADYESTQTFSLFDAGALLLTGPIGLAVTKGHDFANLARQSGGSTKIHNVVSTWTVENGVAHAGDVALATSQNRLAIQGGLDFANREFDELVLALIDPQGCVKVRQTVRGPFSKPVVEQPSALGALAGPVVSLFEKAGDLLRGGRGECEVFYTGSVAPPR
ncbi:MAG: AsmA family protein [Gammaproteobacteria bacterium]